MHLTSGFKQHYLILVIMINEKGRNSYRPLTIEEDFIWGRLVKPTFM